MTRALPYFSICIPQYNRTSFLLEALRSFADQTFRGFEICISDDRSTDGREREIVDQLQSAGTPHVFARAPGNLGYDGNVRNAIALSSGRYVLLMGNDDRLAGPDVLERLHDLLERHGPVAAAITNYRDIPTGRVFRRMTSTGVLGRGPEVAAATFRRYGFVSGVIFEGAGARRVATSAHDGSEMYQMYVGTRLVSDGGALLAIDSVCVEMNIQIRGERVDSYRDPAAPPRSQLALPMSRIFGAVYGGLVSAVAPGERRRVALVILQQLYAFTYPFWLLEYRRVRNTRHALGVYLQVRPSRVLGDVALPQIDRIRLWLQYLGRGVVGLATPLAIFAALEPALYGLAKRVWTSRS